MNSINVLHLSGRMDTHMPWMRLWMLMVYSLVTTSLMAERPFFFSPPFLSGAIYKQHIPLLFSYTCLSARVHNYSTKTGLHFICGTSLMDFWVFILPQKQEPSYKQD